MNWNGHIICIIKGLNMYFRVKVSEVGNGLERALFLCVPWFHTPSERNSLCSILMREQVMFALYTCN